VRLFNLPPERLRVLIHPESLVHALVRTIDGTLYAHASEADMRLPIDIALHWPEERPCLFGALELAGRTLRFMAPDPSRYPMLGLARQALASGEGATIAYNAANEIAVSAFESGSLRFTQIAETVARVLGGAWDSPGDSLDGILKVDSAVRDRARAIILELR
jgi:1-deoxy-D-xylulose-5-phosphate reductoisomerase